MKELIIILLQFLQSENEIGKLKYSINLLSYYPSMEEYSCILNKISFKRGTKLQVFTLGFSLKLKT